MQDIKGNKTSFETPNNLIFPDWLYMINKDETNSIQTPKITWGHTRESSKTQMVRKITE